MQILDSTGFVASDSSYSAMSEWSSDSSISRGNAHVEMLDAEVQTGGRGIRVLKIAPASPLRRLLPLGSFAVQGMVESGDRIIAVDGVAISNVVDLEKLVAVDRDCEIAIFDHRTRMTVSWQIHVRGMAEAV